MALRLQDLAARCGARLEGDGEAAICGPATLDRAGPDEISFLGHPRYESLLATTTAGAVVIANDFEVQREGLALLRVDDPSKAFTAIVAAFAAERFEQPSGVHPTASIAADATVDPSARVGANAVVDAGATVGARAVLAPGAYVGPRATIGEDTVLLAGARVLEAVQVGARCIVHPGAVVGAEGFGFEPTKEGWVRIPQCGTVVVEDDVEIGANTTIDRARFGATRIGRGAKIDNLVHVAHNVEIGASSAIAAQVGIAGSARLDDWVVLGGQVGVNGHIRISSGVRLGGQAGAFGDLTEPGDYIGTPARPRSEALRSMAASGRARELAVRVKQLEARLAQLEEGAR
ncbi:UDP-3-O-acylglucosamine N-acyltransferase [Planctomycetes bacterium Pla163]|uniref:UDP-3-O-acylglucosamine N-acyltransferase n=1 Tax=Rohdeia mirabilis TaxID=2528008 RepID=A0A518D2Z7_9BACT|nr:UDP-3-O-acylglucosamine N-acyltransferase [Planctomycetes bacterium Pla163]